MADQDAEGLQFDNAEYDTPAAGAPTCAACKKPIPNAYYELFGAIVCDSCKDMIVASREGGSKIARFLRAAAFGAGAAIAGFGIYFGVMKLAHLEIGLISILVGYMVGMAVRKGSNGRGGWVYQLLAIFLTYTAISASYSAVIVPEIIANMREKRAAKKEAIAAKKADIEAKKADPKAKKAEDLAQADEDDEDQADLKDMTPGQALSGLALAVVFLVGFAYAIPIMAGMQSPMGLLIIGFALWEAWKLNKRIPFVINGPFTVGGNPRQEAAGYA